ncbi:hypothetical protein ACGF5O_37745 [Streptomyces sp. NPDC048291]|uniref:hypothetical protein n=1 Tax=Streptomyces sp. NPDC048291 TaxID=3365530 RepID=UPI0037157868
MRRTHYRQGDVLVVTVDELPLQVLPVPREDGVVVLAHGEVTGHRHAIAEPHAEPLAPPGDDDQTRFLRIVGAPGRLVHEEHAAITLPDGVYQVIRQREYAPDVRAVFVED